MGVKFKRRRSGKTDYRQRKGLIIQDKNKYATPKYRLVVRFSNKNITCQVVYSTLTHDVVVASAYSRELPTYGLNFGLTNYAAAYCTGLLIARRVLTKLGLADAYKGLAEASGEDYLVEENEEGPRPFLPARRRPEEDVDGIEGIRCAERGLGWRLGHSPFRQPLRWRGRPRYPCEVHLWRARRSIHGYLEGGGPGGVRQALFSLHQGGRDLGQARRHLQEGPRCHPRQPSPPGQEGEEGPSHPKEVAGSQEDLRAEEERSCSENCCSQGWPINFINFNIVLLLSK